jgi:hypothetical protein
MQHIHISDPSGCTIINVDGARSERDGPPPHAARLCRQCERETWRLTPTCMHCGHDRLGAARLLTRAAVTLAAGVVIFHPLITG